MFWSTLLLFNQIFKWVIAQSQGRKGARDFQPLITLLHSTLLLPTDPPEPAMICPFPSDKIQKIRQAVSADHSMCCLCVPLKSNRATWQLNRMDQKIVAVITQHLKFSSSGIFRSRALSELSPTAWPQTFHTLSTHLSSQVCVRNRSVTQDYGLLSNLSCLGKRPVVLITVPQATQQTHYTYMYMHAHMKYMCMCCICCVWGFHILSHIRFIYPRWFEGCCWAICSPWTTTRKGQF